MKSYWLMISRRWHVPERADELGRAVIGYGQLLLFLLAMVGLFFWYQAMQETLANILNQPVTTGMPER